MRPFTVAEGRDDGSGPALAVQAPGRRGTCRRLVAARDPRQRPRPPAKPRRASGADRRLLDRWRRRDHDARRHPARPPCRAFRQACGALPRTVGDRHRARRIQDPDLRPRRRPVQQAARSPIRFAWAWTTSIGEWTGHEPGRVPQVRMGGCLSSSTGCLRHCPLSFPSSSLSPVRAVAEFGSGSKRDRGGIVSNSSRPAAIAAKPLPAGQDAVVQEHGQVRRTPSRTAASVSVSRSPRTGASLTMESRCPRCRRIHPNALASGFRSRSPGCVPPRPPTPSCDVRHISR